MENKSHLFLLVTARPPLRVRSGAACFLLPPPSANVLTLVGLFQDYSDATTVMIRGRATLTLQNKTAAIDMASESTAVR